MTERFRESQVTLDSEMTFEELSALRAVARKVPADRRVLEIGTAAGGTLAQTLKDAPQIDPAQVTVIDPFCYFPNQEELWRKNLSQHGVDPAPIRILKMTSARALRLTSDEPSDYALAIIDGAHKLKYVMQDTRWLSRLQAGGVAAFHDYTDKFPGVQKAVNTFLALNRNYRALSQAGNLFFVVKERASSKVETPSGLILRMTLLSVWWDWKRSLAKRAKKLGLGENGARPPSES